LLFWAPFAFGEALIKVEEALSRSRNDLNTADDKVGLTESFSVSTELCNAQTGI
jgi:hypothetical protein